MLRIFVLVLAALPLTVGAQTGHEHHQHSSPAPKAGQKASPAPSVAAPSTVRVDAGSTFVRYQRFTPDEPLKDWRAVNDTVSRIGGWRVYAQEAARSIEAEKKSIGGKP